MKRAFIALACAAAALIGEPAVAADLSVLADAYTDQAAAGTSFGTNGILAVSGGRIALVRFNATAVAQASGGTATLKLKVLLTKNAANGVSVRLVTGAWSEATVTARTLPAIAGTALDQKSIVSSDQGKIVSFNVSAALAAWKANPATNFGLALVAVAPTPNLQLGSREGGNPAVLSISGATADNDVTVSQSGGDYPDPAAASDNAFSGDTWCVSPTATKPCIIHVAAGIYAINKSTGVPDGVAMVGEEKGTTLLLVNGSFAAQGTGRRLVSDLTIIASGNAMAAAGQGGQLTLERVSLRGVVGLDISSSAGTVTVTDSEISAEAQGAMPALAVDCGGGCGNVTFVRSRLAALAASNAALGFEMSDGFTTLAFEDTSIFVSGATQATALDSSNEGIPSIRFTRGEIDVTSTGTAAPVGLETIGNGFQIIGTTINVPGGTAIRSTETLDSVLDGATIHGGTGFFGSGGTRIVSVLRSQLHGGAGAALILDGARGTVESSIIKGAQGLVVRNGALAASSSQVAGPIVLENSTATCNRVLDGALSLRPANCVTP